MRPPLFRMPRLRRRSLSSRGTSANKRYASTMGYGTTSLQGTEDGRVGEPSLIGGQ